MNRAQKLGPEHDDAKHEVDAFIFRNIKGCNHLSLQLLVSLSQDITMGMQTFLTTCRRS